MIKFPLKIFIIGIMSSAVLFACVPTIPKEALRLSPESLAQRQIQTRRFDTSDETEILSACAGLLQDLGFNLDESESRLGVIVASKERSAVEAGQVVLSVLAALLTGVATPVDEVQKMRACVVSKPAGEKKENTAVRVTFQRIVWDTNGRITKLETLNDPKAYEEFFDKLSKAVFLEAHEI